MSTHSFSCREAKQKDLVEYLDHLGIQPQKIRGNDHWYLSPFREEKTPSFKVHKKFNVWYDHGIGKGGNLIDFGILYHHCSVREFLQKLQKTSSFQQPDQHLHTEQNSHPSGSHGKEKNKIKILSVSPIEDPALIHYLTARNIPMQMARQHCRQVDFELYGKQLTALGFPNRSGGYELRSANFKGSSAPKDSSFIDQGSGTVAVFEGFFSYLSFVMINQVEADMTNYLVLNSLAFLEKARPLMEKHEQIHLYLDRDQAGVLFTKKALQWGDKYRDHSHFYRGHKDINEWLTAGIEQSRQSHRQGRHL